VQTAEPVAILYLPAAQAVHTPPFGPVKPTLHVQAASAELEIGELELVGHARQAVATVAPVVVKYVPAAQSVQTAEPVAILYLPTAQEVHVPPFGPVKPTLHVQAERLELPPGELELVGQNRQNPALEAPTNVWYVPEKQLLHTVLPVLD
jgi:hypothetical protein